MNAAAKKSDSGAFYLVFDTLPRRKPWAWGASPQNLFKRVLLNQEMHLEKKLSKNIYFPWRNSILKKQFRIKNHVKCTGARLFRSRLHLFIEFTREQS